MAKKIRGISFEKISEYIEKDEILDIVDNPSANHPDQKIYIINIKNYIYIVPFIENKNNVNEIFLKTIFKSRKQTKAYIKEAK